MRLKRLKIQALPGIDPGFTFEPLGAGINIVTGPNAIGKSSLARALSYLLRGQKSDPPVLSLEAEFESGGTTWRVQRNGSQVAWYRDGNPASPPALPGADQTGLYRLSMEHLLTGDKYDTGLAQELRNRLRGGFDLDAPRLNPGPRFAQAEATNLINAQQVLRQAEGVYDALERQEQDELPRLSREIKAAEEAQIHRDRLQLGLELHDAINAKKSCAEELKTDPVGMDRLRGDEQERLTGLEKKSENLRDKLRDQQRRLHDAETALEETGFEQSGPETEQLEETELRLQLLGQKVVRRSSARDVLAQADGGLKKAREPFNDAGESPRLDAQSLAQANTVAAPLIKAQARHNELQLKLDQAGNSPDEAEINKLYEAGSALREWLAATAAESGTQPASPGRRTRLALWIILAASGLAVLLAGIQQALPAAVAALAAFCVAAWVLFYLRRHPDAGSSADGAKQRFVRTGLAGPLDWTAAAVQEYLRAHIDKRHSALILQRERAAQAGAIRPELEKAEAEIASLQIRKQEVEAALGFNPVLPSVGPDIFLQYCRQLFEAESRHAQAQERLGEVERDIAEDAALVRDFLAPWRRSDAPALDDAEDDRHINRVQIAFQDLKRRASDAREARKDITRYLDDILATRKDIEANSNDISTIFTGCGLDPDARIELDRRLGLLKEWQAKRETLRKAEFEEESIRARLEAHPEIIKQIEEGRIAELQSNYDAAEQQAGEHSRLIEQRTEITTRLKDAGADHRLSQARAAVDSARAALQDKREQAWRHEATELLLGDVEQVYLSENEPEVLSHARALFREITANAFDLQLDKDGIFIARDLEQEESRDLDKLSSGTRMQLLLALRLGWIEAQEQGRETLPLFLDEALTTSDEDRFAVMANSLERLAVTDNRQIFYLSARRHECALWKHATGSEPPIIDLAMARFPREARPPLDYDIALPPPLPSPDGREPEAYASVLGVRPLNPRLEPGAAHLFYILRDDLDTMYQLMDTWRITSLGQLEALLDSDALSAAVTDTGLQSRLRQRCRVVRIWTALWRQGRGRPVNRIALEQSCIVSNTFIDRVVDLAETVSEDGKALAQALRAGQVSGFRTSKIEELECWMADEGYTDEGEILSAEERRRLTPQQAMSNAGVYIEDVNQVITWLE